MNGGNNLKKSNIWTKHAAILELKIASNSFKLKMRYAAPSVSGAVTIVSEMMADLAFSINVVVVRLAIGFHARISNSFSLITSSFAYDSKIGMLYTVFALPMYIAPHIRVKCSSSTNRAPPKMSKRENDVQPQRSLHARSERTTPF